MTYTLAELFPVFHKARKRHICRLCGSWIQPEDPRCRWTTVERGYGFRTSHAHPECYQSTLDAKWDEQDWECCLPGDMTRPTPKP